MSNPTLDQIQDLSDEEQQKFHQYAQRRLRQIRREIRNKTENANDRRKQCS